MTAAHYKLDHVCAIIDYNKVQENGPTNEIKNLEPLRDKWTAFGWHVQRVNGNDLSAVLAAFDAARQHNEAQPRVILLDTLMGKGVPFLERREKNHFIRVNPPEWQQALAILDAQHAGAI